jgi:hypothetical protein
VKSPVNVNYRASTLRVMQKKSRPDIERHRIGLFNRYLRRFHNFHFSSALFIGPRTHPLSTFEIIAIVLLSLVGRVMGGYFYGSSVWKALEKKCPG